MYMHVHIIVFEFPSYLDRYQVLSGVPYAIQQVLISDLFYTQQYICVNSSLPIRLTLHSSLELICLFSTSV